MLILYASISIETFMIFITCYIAVLICTYIFFLVLLEYGEDLRFDVDNFVTPLNK